MSTHTGTFGSDTESLTPEILLKIFLDLDYHQVTMLRSICKHFLDIIDNNKSLWRVMDWIQVKDGTAVQALEKFDERSASTLKEVSIFQADGDLEKERLFEVFGRSKDTLTDLMLMVESSSRNFLPKTMELASTAPLLESLILCESGIMGYGPPGPPKVRLIRSCGRFSIYRERSSNLQILWCANREQDWQGKLDVSSLVSFANPVRHDPLQLRSVISNFSQSIVHLSISLDEPLTREVTPSSLSCPSLRILEGQFYSGFPSWLEAPHLRVLIADFNEVNFISELPISIEELWLLSKYPGPATRRNLHFLPQVCPRLKVLKLGKTLMEDSVLGEKDISEYFKAREQKVQGGVEIEGIKMVSLEKLIVPTQLFGPAELKRLRDLVGEVINMKDYPNFIELEY